MTHYYDCYYICSGAYGSRCGAEEIDPNYISEIDEIKETLIATWGLAFGHVRT